MKITKEFYLACFPEVLSLLLLIFLVQCIQTQGIYLRWGAAKVNSVRLNHFLLHLRDLSIVNSNSHPNSEPNNQSEHKELKFESIETTSNPRAVLEHICFYEYFQNRSKNIQINAGHSD